MRRRAVGLGQKGIHEGPAHGGVGPMRQTLGDGIDLAHLSLGVDDDERARGGFKYATHIARIGDLDRGCLDLGRREPLGLDDGGHRADHLTILILDRHGGDRDQHGPAGRRIGQQVLEPLDGLAPQRAGAGQQIRRHGSTVGKGDAPGGRMEPQAQQFGVAASQQLMRRAIGIDEFALAVGLDQGHGHGIQGFEQALVRALGGFLHQVQLG